MARILVLTVDRDNDLGIKTSIRGPVVGRRQVLTAALKLGIADPEESDTNAILGALSQHDQLLENGADEDEVEVAILTGDEKVGVRSDRAIAAQLEEVVSAFQPDEALLITDGGRRRVRSTDHPIPGSYWSRRENHSQAVQGYRRNLLLHRQSTGR